MDIEDENLIFCDDMLSEEQRILGWRVIVEREKEQERVARNRRLRAEIAQGRSEFERARRMFDSFLEG